MSNRIYKSHKICSQCARYLPVEAFYACRSKPDGHASECKVCTHRRYEVRCGRGVQVGQVDKAGPVVD